MTVTTYRDVVFSRPPGYRPLSLDLYVPDGPARGLCLYLHGGGWRVGSRSDGPGPTVDRLHRSNVHHHYAFPIPPSSASSCGGSAPAADGAASSTYQAQLAYAHCMQTHGVPGFPDPSPSMNISISGQPPANSPAGRANAEVFRRR